MILKKMIEEHGELQGTKDSAAMLAETHEQNMQSFAEPPAIEESEEPSAVSIEADQLYGGNF